MATTSTVSKLPRRESQSELMARASASTANIGWLNEYLSLWSLLERTARRIQHEQLKQVRFDLAANQKLSEVRLMAEEKLEALQAAYDKAYAAHLLIMDMVLGEE